MIDPRYDVREALGVAAHDAALRARNYARESEKWYRLARESRDQVDVLAPSEIRYRDLLASLSTTRARLARKKHDRSRLWFARWCALDALVRVYDDVGGAR